jgi:hypothetical protein
VTRVKPVGGVGRESAPSLAALSLAVCLTLVVSETLLRDRVGLLFDVGFVVLCVALAWLVRPGDFIVVGLLPPLALIVVFGLLGLTSPELVGHPDDGLVQAIVSGLGHHSVALLAGYALCLATLGYRQRQL